MDLPTCSSSGQVEKISNGHFSVQSHQRQENPMKHWQTGLVVVGLVAACLSAADPLKIKRIPLAGLTEISVLVEPISPGFEKTFDREEFQTAVELRLRRAGIKVVEPDPKASKPCLIVNLNMMRA